MGIGTIEQRAERPRRIKVFQPATLVASGGSARAHLLDLSASGALAHAAVPPAAGARVQLECRGVMRTARVRWRDGPRFGLAFDLPLGREELDRLAPPLRVPA